MPTIEERALALFNEVLRERGGGILQGGRRCYSTIEALCRAIEAHDATLAEFEAFKREVSRRVRGFRSAWQHKTPSRDGFDAVFERFIIPEPVDPLVAVMAFNSLDTATAEQRAANLREDAKALGYEIKLVEVGDED